MNTTLMPTASGCLSEHPCMDLMQNARAYFMPEGNVFTDRGSAGWSNNEKRGNTHHVTIGDAFTSNGLVRIASEKRYG
jgi:hypothetical protein